MKTTKMRSLMVRSVLCLSAITALLLLPAYAGPKNKDSSAVAKPADTKPSDTKPAEGGGGGKEVTLKGIRYNQYHLRSFVPGIETYEDAAKLEKFSCLLAFEGTPAVEAEVEKIWSEYHPGPSLDGDAARKLEEQFRKRVLYYLDGPLVDAKFIKADNYGMGGLISVTGTIHEQDGKKYLTVASTGAYKGPTYPERIKGPAVPLVKLPVKPPLTIKLTDKLTDALIYVPAGKFYMGNPLEQYPHWQEAPQHMVTLTKGFYLSDHPITIAEYMAVTGDANCNPKAHDPGCAVNISCEMFQKYVKALQALNPGKVIRAPSRAEWEYAARCGASSLSWMMDRPDARYGEICDLGTVLKTKKPNAWGFYGMVFDSGSERSCDKGFVLKCQDATDPRLPCKECDTNPAKDHIHANGGCSGHYTIQELLNDNSNVGVELGGDQRNRYKHLRERILVEE